MLYSASFAAMQVTGGVYVPLTMKDGDLRSGPGGKYSNVGPFTMNNREAHCYTLACDQLTPDMIASCITTAKASGARVTAMTSWQACPWTLPKAP